MLSQVVGNEGPINLLKAALASGKLPHAVLLTAADGCGRGFVARCLAADYLFPSGGAAASAVMRGEGSEVLIVKGEGKSGQIPISRIRAVRQNIHLSSLSANGRVVLVHDAHLMAAPAANALLKVLEEPPKGALFILTARNPSSVPITIQSRCALYSLAPTNVDACAQFLKEHSGSDVDSDVFSKLAIIFGGRIGAGMRTLQNPDNLLILEDALTATAAALQKNRYNLLRVFSAYEGRAEGDRDKRELLLSYIGDVLAAVFHGSKGHGLPAGTPACAAALLPMLGVARKSLVSNASPKLTFTALAAKLAASA